MAELVSIKRNVDVSPGQAAPAVFHCSQGDVGSKIILGLLNNGTAYAIPSGVTVTIEGSESNGSIFTPISATASGSDITFYLTGEMTAVAGPAICQAVLKSGSNILGTANFTLEVESSPMGADAPPVFTDAGWTWMLNKLNTEFVPALGNETIIDAIESKADQSDLETLENTVVGHTGSITVLNNTVNTLNQSVTENRQNIALKLDKNQGTANAGKYLKVGADGNVETADLDVTTDKTLSITDKAADAKAVGDEMTNLKADLNDVDQKINFGLTGIRSLAYRTSEFIPEYYIPNGGVGTTVDITNVKRWSTTSAKAAYCLFTVQKGDIIHAEGYSLSGSTNRFMVLLDSDKKVLWSSPTGASVRDITVTATVDGYCLIDAAHYSSNQYREHKAIQLYGDTYKPLRQDISIWNQYKSKGYVNIQGDWAQGEFGSFADVIYAAKSPWMTLEYDTAFICTDPENYYLTFYINNNGTLTKNTSYPTWAVFQANTNIRVAVNAKDETETLSPDSAKTKVLISLAISENERLKDTYSSVGVFDQIGIIGDSFAVGSMHWDNDGYKGYPNLSWGKLMCKRNGNNCTLYAHGGYGIKRFVEYILSTVLADEPCNLYWWGLGINDNETARTNPTATGTIEDITAHETDGNYPDTIYGNFGRAVSQIKAHAPLAKHVFASCIKDNVNNRYTSYSAINTVLKIVAEHYGFPFIEITDDPFYWSAFYRDSAWTGHPVLIGYAGMSWANERLLNKCIVDNMTYFRDYGRTNNPDDTDPTGTE